MEVTGKKNVLLCAFNARAHTGTHAHKRLRKIDTPSTIRSIWM